MNRGAGLVVPDKDVVQGHVRESSVVRGSFRALVRTLFADLRATRICGVAYLCRRVLNLTVR